MVRSRPFTLDLPADHRWAPVALAVAAAATPARVDLDRLENLLMGISEAVDLAIGIPGSTRVTMTAEPDGDRLHVVVAGRGDDIEGDDVAGLATTVSGYVLDALADGLRIEHRDGAVEIGFSARLRPGFGDPPGG